jgi:hypothetical protein
MEWRGVMPGRDRRGTLSGSTQLWVVRAKAHRPDGTGGLKVLILLDVKGQG